MDFESAAPYRVIRVDLASRTSQFRVPVNAASLAIRTLVGPGWLPIRLNDPRNPVMIAQHNTVIEQPVRDIWLDMDKVQITKGTAEFIISALPRFPFILPPDESNFSKDFDGTSAAYVLDSLPVAVIFEGSGDVVIETGTVDEQNATLTVTPGKIIYGLRAYSLSGAGAVGVVTYADPFWRDGASLFT